MTAPNRQTPREPPWEHGSDREVASFGTWLRRQREIREIPLREIADVTKISIRYLEALEQDRFDVLPAPVFAKGFLREYAKYVGVDPDEVVNSYLLAQEEEAEEADESTDVAAPTPRKGPAGLLLLVLGVGGAVALIAIVIAYSKFRQSSQPQRVLPPIAASVIPDPPEPVPTAAVAASPLGVTLDFTEDCWVEVEVDGERRLSELHVQGESMRIEADERVKLALGNPAGVRLEVNGHPYDFGYVPGRVARDVEIDLETVRVLETGPE